MSSLPAQAAPEKPRWTLVIHGGAGMLQRDTVAPELDAAARAGLGQALDAGSRVLADGGDALDAVEAAVKVLEDDPSFNAGRGSVFTYDGRIELDAAIMDGRSRAAGAVTGITRTRYPITVARAVMENSLHVFLGGEGADAFSVEQGFEQLDPDWFATAERKRQLDEIKANKAGYDVDFKYGTVGAVAVDEAGHVAAATSTGGITGKRWGRIGNSPIIGAGTFADDRGCAVSATGAGEFFIRQGVAHEICARVRLAGEDISQAADVAMKDVRTMGGTGGVIVVSPDGTGTWSFTTLGMYRGKATSSGERIVAIYGDE